MITKKSCWIPITFGIILILIGLLFPAPGMALTTYSSLDGESTSSYVMDKTYSAIDEYVGGDAYNFIIGASLIAGKLSGAMMVKGLFVVGGLLCLCAGITMFSILKNSNTTCSKFENSSEQFANDVVAGCSSPKSPVVAENSDMEEDSEQNIHNV